MNIKADVVVDCQFGDCGKGKCSHALMSQKNLFGKNKYDYCLRYNGSGNAGHTIIHNGKKFITHQIPAGIFYGIKSIIGHGCVLNPTKFFEELQYLKDNDIDCDGLIKISHTTHIITPEHIIEDSKDVKIGTTKSGNGPAYRDKYARIGIRAEDIKELQPYIIDIYKEFFRGGRVLCEGAQGFGLDIDWGEFYPYLTSSHTTVGGAILNGIPHNCIGNVYGICKSYVTYVGAMKFQPDYASYEYSIYEKEIFNKIQQVGKEIGATTGRIRQINWLDIDLLNKAIDINGVNILIINKMDILNEVGVWRVYKKNKYGVKELIFLDSEKEFKKYLKKNIHSKIIFSYSPEKI